MVELNKTKVEELLNNEEFKVKAIGIKTSEDIVALFNEYGIDITLDDVDTAINVSSYSDELSEDNLDNVVGGLKGPVYWLGYAIGRLVSKKSGKCKF